MISYKSIGCFVNLYFDNSNVGVKKRNFMTTEFIMWNIRNILKCCGYSRIKFQHSFKNVPTNEEVSMNNYIKRNILMWLVILRPISLLLLTGKMNLLYN